MLGALEVPGPAGIGPDLTAERSALGSAKTALPTTRRVAKTPASRGQVRGIMSSLELTNGRIRVCRAAAHTHTLVVTYLRGGYR